MWISSGGGEGWTATIIVFIFADPGTTYRGTLGGSADISLVQSDAEEIAAQVRDVHAKPGTGHVVWAVFDVQPSPGIPASRFVYTNQPVFLTIQPALLSALSMGRLLGGKHTDSCSMTQSYACFINDVFTRRISFS